MVEEGMPSATASLPSDPQALRVLAASLQEALAAKERELAARDAEIHAKTLHIEKLRATLALMKRARFGRSSERLEQLELLIGDLEEEAAEQQARQDATVARRPSRSGEPRRRGRQPLPAHLPRERVEHEATCVCPACGSKDRQRPARGAGVCALALQGGGPRPAEDELSDLRDHHPGPAPVAANRARSAGPQPPRPCPGGQVLRPCSALPAERHLRPGRGRTRTLDARRLGRPSG